MRGTSPPASKKLRPILPETRIWVEAGQVAWQDDCVFCNRYKGSDLASIDIETGRIVRLFHPRRDTWKRHSRLEGGLIVPRTAVGRVTEYLLQFNRSDRAEVRSRLIVEGRYPR